jgi:hypothetical protein
VFYSPKTTLQDHEPLKASRLSVEWLTIRSAYVFRFGLFEIPCRDFELIKAAI